MPLMKLPYKDMSYGPMQGVTDPINPTTPRPTYSGPTMPQKSKFNYLGAVNKVMPFASNLINSFRKAPAPKLPHLDSEIGGGRHVTNIADVDAIESGVRASNKAADMNLDENTAAAVKASNLATRYNQLSDTNERTANKNIMIDNEGMKTDAAIRASNNNKLDQFDNSVIESNIANQNNQSANFANVSDKYIAMQNEKAKSDLDMQKTKLLVGLDSNGSLGRYMQRLGLPVPNVNGTNTSVNASGDNTGTTTAPDLPYDPLTPKTDYSTKPYLDPTRQRRATGGFVKKFNSKRMMPVLK